MMKKFALIVSLCTLVLFAPVSKAFTEFVVANITLEGLDRISAGTVFNYLPIKIGDSVDQKRVSGALNALFKTGFFKDIRLDRIGDILIVTLEERPAISNIDISGNDLLETEPLLEGLKGIGLAKGQVFKRALLEQVEQELRRQYFSQGQYSVTIESNVIPLEPLERNLVSVEIDIKEGRPAKIKQITIVGNDSYTDDELRKGFQLSTASLFSFITDSDQYSKQALAGDLEALRSFYLDRGFIDFRIRSTQVSVSSNKEDIYVTINISEGNLYTVSEVKIAGDLKVDPQELVALVQLHPEDIFSRRQTTNTSTLISDRLGAEGYAFANVNTIPEVNKEDKTVAITFYVDPGHKVYVRRINYTGNTKTRDEVIRREMRQMEAARFATDKVQLSKIRLQRLGFFEGINVETPQVPGTHDQVDVNYSVTETASGNILAGVGFSQSQGIILNASVSQNNFMGSGKRVSFAINNSDLNESYRFSYTNPFYTVNGVSRGFNISYRQTNAEAVNVARYTTDVFSVGVNYGIPINETDRIRLGFSYDQTDLTLGVLPSDELQDFVDENGEEFDTIKTTLGWSHDSRNRAIFPTRGNTQSVSLEVASPGGTLQYYKARYRSQAVRPVFLGLTMSVKTDIGYGDGYKDTDGLPLFENYFAGGVRSVRGYEDFSLGPKDSLGDTLGGNVKVVGNFELFAPMTKDLSRTLRLGAFFDIGNVFGEKDKFRFDDLRYSVGVSAIWISPLGPLRFSLGWALNDEPGDETQIFQFALGAF